MTGGYGRLTRHRARSMRARMDALAPSLLTYRNDMDARAALLQAAAHQFGTGSECM